ncbi:MAG: NYN domain-containing protein [Gemmatimonadetes bacterium]|nr:NYN domain-containing protein [Gemmatimonadota bacterium]
MARVSFLVDGFNVYHSLDQLQKVTGASVKWLDVRRLCGAYLQAVRQHVGERAELAGVHYFSARPAFLLHRKPDTVARFDLYMRALRETGVGVNLSQFKRKDITCPRCLKSFTRHEEKETDVALAMKLVEVFVTDECDTAVLVTGDTDLIPSVRTLNLILPRSQIGVAFPVLRQNIELQRTANYWFRINQKDIQRAQFPPDFVLSDGTILSKPRRW